MPVVGALGFVQPLGSVVLTGELREQLCDHGTWFHSRVFAVDGDFADFCHRNHTEARMILGVAIAQSTDVRCGPLHRVLVWVVYPPAGCFPNCVHGIAKLVCSSCLQNKQNPNPVDLCTACDGFCTHILRSPVFK